jgi:hypothetical protein
VFVLYQHCCCICTAVVLARNVVAVVWQGSCMPGAGHPLSPSSHQWRAHTVLRPSPTPFVVACRLACCSFGVGQQQLSSSTEGNPGVVASCVLLSHCMHDWLVLFARAHTGFLHTASLVYPTPVLSQHLFWPLLGGTPCRTEPFGGSSLVCRVHTGLVQGQFCLKHTACTRERSSSVVLRQMSVTPTTGHFVVGCWSCDELHAC